MARTAPTPNDPFGWGIVITCDPRMGQAAAAVWPGANRGIYLRTMNGGPVSAIGFEVGVQSGNVSVAAFANTGVGKLAVPSTRLATSGTVACPASGYAEVALGATVNLAPGDWLFLSCDNTTASFARYAPLSAAFNAGTAYRQDTAHPAPSPAGTLAATSSIPILVGVP